MRPNPVSALAGVALAAFAVLAAYGHTDRPTPPPPPPAPVVTEAPAPVEPDADPDAGVLKLAQVAIPVPPVVTGLPYPASCHAVGKLPDPTCTPGSVNPAVTPSTIGATICKSGWTATVRPPASNTGPVKRAAMRAYGIPASQSGTTELDHKIPLETGGSDDSSNLWPEVSDIPNAGFRNHKDAVENDLHAAICSGKISLSAAQIAIATDWTTAEQVLGIK